MKCPKCGSELDIVQSENQRTIPYVECVNCTKKGERWNETILEIWNRAEKAESTLAEQKAKCDLCHEAQYQEYAKVKAELDRVRERIENGTDSGLIVREIKSIIRGEGK